GPVATQATVPSVTQMPLSEAVEMLRERGLNALPVDDATHCEVVRDLQSGQWPLYWVKHQGIAPEEPLATSSLVLLSVDVGRTVGGLAGGSMGTGISNLDEPTDADVGVGPGDNVGGLVDGGQGDGNTGSPGRPP